MLPYKFPSNSNQGMNIVIYPTGKHYLVHTNPHKYIGYYYEGSIFAD